MGRAPTTPGAPCGFATPFLKSTWMNRRLLKCTRSARELLTFKCYGITYYIFLMSDLLHDVGYWNDNQVMFFQFFIWFILLLSLLYHCPCYLSLRDTWNFSKKQSFCEARRPEVAEGAIPCQATTAARRLTKNPPNPQIGNKYVQCNYIVCLYSNGRYSIQNNNMLWWTWCETG